MSFSRAQLGTHLTALFRKRQGKYICTQRSKMAMLGAILASNFGACKWWAVQDLNLWPPVCKLSSGNDNIGFTGFSRSESVIIGAF